MDQDNFNTKLEDLTHKQKTVLKRFLEGETPNEIAIAMNYDPSNIRRHLNNVCTKFGFINEQGERFSYQQELVDLFVQHKPEWVKIDFWDDDHPHKTELDFPDRPVSPQSPFYIKRFLTNSSLVETLCSQKVLQPGALIRIKAPKKMGKTSLLNHILAEAKNSGYRIIRLNLRQAEESIFDNLDHFLQWFCTNISQKLNLESRLDDYWDNERLGSMASCTTYFQSTAVSKKIWTELVSWLRRRTTVGNGGRTSLLDPASSLSPAPKRHNLRETFADCLYSSRNLHVIIKQDGSRNEQAGTAYANLLLSVEGQKLVEQSGFVSI